MAIAWLNHTVRVGLHRQPVLFSNEALLAVLPRSMGLLPWFPRWKMNKKAAPIAGSRLDKGGGGEGIRTPVLVTRIPDLYMLIRSSSLGKPAPADRIRLPDCHCNLSLFSPDTRLRASLFVFAPHLNRHRVKDTQPLGC